MGDAQYFSTLDLKCAYWQISVDEKDRHKTVFVTQRGLFEFNRMPFGLVNAPTTFQRAMDLVLCGLSYVICLCYLDYVTVFVVILMNIAIGDDAWVHGLCVKPEKCTIAARQVSFLGHVISDSGIMPDPAKIEGLIHG